VKLKSFNIINVLITFCVLDESQSSL